jgi:hypothetical protein
MLVSLVDHFLDSTSSAGSRDRTAGSHVTLLVSVSSTSGSAGLRVLVKLRGLEERAEDRCRAGSMTRLRTVVILRPTTWLRSQVLSVFSTFFDSLPLAPPYWLAASSRSDRARGGAPSRRTRLHPLPARCTFVKLRCRTRGRRGASKRRHRTRGTALVTGTGIARPSGSARPTFPVRFAKCARFFGQLGEWLISRPILAVAGKFIS